MDFPVTVESQDAFDALVKERLDRQARKYADHDQIKARAAELETASAEHEKALTAEKKRADEAEARATAAEAWKADRESHDALGKVRDEVAKTAGVPAAALRGSSKEELEAHAVELKALLDSKPRSPALERAGQGGEIHQQTTPGIGTLRAAYADSDK